jgi:hypothetical protein
LRSNSSKQQSNVQNQINGGYSHQSLTQKTNFTLFTSIQLLSVVQGGKKQRNH